MNKLIFKNILPLATVLLLSTASNAQNKPAFDKGDNTIGESIGLGVSYAHYSNAVNVPAITLLYDHVTFGEVGQGTIGIGGNIGFKTIHYN